MGTPARALHAASTVTGVPWHAGEVCVCVCMCVCVCVCVTHHRSYNIRAQDPKGAINMPGTPGVFLYLLAMGQGVSKKENIHHW